MNIQKSHSALSMLQSVCRKQKIPFVSYRLPLQTEIITLVQHHSFPEKPENLNDLHQRTGFIIAPFTETNSHATYFLEPDCVFFDNNIDSVYIDKLAANNRFIDVPDNRNSLQTTSREEFTGNVAKAVSAMKSHEFQKVVLSKVRVESLPDNFSAEDFFLKLCSKYPHAFVYLLQIPGVGCWTGATPEPLLTLEDGKVKTVSLAGTQIATDLETNAYQWSDKEIEEQGIVTNFIEQTIRSLQIQNITKSGPKNYRAANLIHLKTEFEFPGTELKNRLAELLKAFHPTPSVGGLPKTEARNFILANEKHDRSYYTGFFGPVNINERTDIFVNLRCLQLFDKEFVLYSGAGITAASVPENEWEETDNKMMTMMNVMKIPDLKK